ncbi:hypothetical protein Micbo1qcDRAFT_225754 [Microdochium bolleyi]|uniref:Developmental regulatory protein wetA n=1 Tax=Microdochium bolleyi TaxID=196109 RepID=A0A136J109_9PEZI|nr:hypothetical protein Micbo1qcDRAFT_225754 [Microdochium bolleyi]
MAFVATPYIMENDPNQSLYWTEHDEAEITNDHFFDQFVSFEGGDGQTSGGGALHNPPSPSLMLDSIEHHNLDLSYNADMAPGFANGPGLATTSPIEIPARATPTLRRKTNLPSVLTGGPAGPSIAMSSQAGDPDHLRLEGISLRSPRHKLPITDSPPSTRGASTSPRKHGLLDSVYATIRKATHRNKLSSKSSQPRTSIMNLDIFRNSIKTEVEDVSPAVDLSQFADSQLLAAQTGPIDSNGLPLSPPLTGRIPPQAMRPNGEGFVTGHFEDPFGDSQQPQRPILTIPATQGDMSANSPIATPAMNTEDFYKYAANMAEPDVPLRRPKQQRSTSIAEWPSEGLLTDDSQLWSDESSSSAYVTDNGMANNGWWDPNGKINHSFNVNNNVHHSGLRRASTSVLSSINTNSNQSLGFDMDSIAGHSDSSQQQEMAYEYDTPELSGLMIQMPYSQAPSQSDFLVGAPIPGDHMGAAYGANPAMVPQMPPTPSGGHDHQQYIPTHHGFTEHKRPRPRAPSSGARHYGSLTSPRKPSMHRSGSRPMLREESPSPTPTPNTAVRQRSASISAVRKKKSWCRQQQQQREQQQQQQNSRTTPNTPAGLTSSASFGSLPGGGGGGAVGTTMGVVGPAGPFGGGGSGISSRSSSVGGGGISLGGIDFVNFTPSDKTVLMTGVAPSGSSKTKARREKEAADRRRRLNEAALQAVQAAGGDVEKLRLLEQGFTLETE